MDMWTIITQESGTDYKSASWGLQSQERFPPVIALSANLLWKCMGNVLKVYLHNGLTFRYHHRSEFG